MKRNLIIFIFSVFRLTCLGQSKDASYTLSTEFAPSLLLNGSTLIIHKKPDSSFAELKVYQISTEVKLSFCDTAKLSANDLIKLTNFLQLYHSKNLTNKRVKSNKYLPERIGEDGIYVNVNLAKNGRIKKYHFWSPLKESEDGKLMDLLLVLMQSHFQDDEAVDYIKQLKRFF